MHPEAEELKAERLNERDYSLIWPKQDAASLVLRHSGSDSAFI
jgi:hypothetical protein